MTNHMPAADTPDNYRGLHNKEYVTQLSCNPHAGIAHLCVGTSDYPGTYCTTLNPRYRLTLPGLKLRYPDGGYIIVQRRGVCVGTLLRLNTITVAGDAYEFCAECMSMAMCSAQMKSQRDYPIMSLLG